MQKTYTGDAEQRCAHMGGKLCSRVCPTCTFYRPYMMGRGDGSAPFEHWDCSIAVGSQIAHETIGAIHDVRVAIESLRKEIVRLEHARDTLASERVKGGSKQIAQVLEDGFTALLSGGEVLPRNVRMDNISEVQETGNGHDN